MIGRFIKAKFRSDCAETGKHINKGEKVFYHFKNKKAYCLTSSMFIINQKKEKQFNVISKYLSLNGIKAGKDFFKYQAKAIYFFSLNPQLNPYQL